MFTFYIPSVKFYKFCCLYKQFFSTLVFVFDDLKEQN